MAKKIRMDSMTIEIVKAMEEYTQEVKEEVMNAAKKVAEESARQLKESSPEKTGKYKKGWAVKEANGGYTVYNRTAPQLTHLLEKGHAKRNGGRVPGISHIAPVEKEAIEKFEKMVEGAL